MGRNPWATPEQTKFLESFVDQLEKAKTGTGLTVFYEGVAVEFIKRWESPRPPKMDANLDDPEKVKELSDKYRTTQISNWYKNHRRQAPAASSTKPKPVVLDLTGISARKPCPLQPYQAYSSRYYNETGSPLHKIVQDLWVRREEQGVISLLAPFMVAEAAGDHRMLFHNVVMRLKYSELSDDEKQDMKDWIDKEVEERWDRSLHPWKTGVDDLTAENRHIQSHIDALPHTMQAALEEVERVTGLKAFLLLGGPIPAKDGAISTQLYVTGRSHNTNLTFSKSWGGYTKFYEAFVGWLRTTYSEEERERRRGCSEDVSDGNPPCENAHSVSGEAAPPLPAFDEQPRVSAHPPAPNGIPELLSLGTTADEPSHLPPSSIPAAAPQLSTDAVVEPVRNPSAEADITGDGPQPTPSSPVEDELQDPPTPLTTPEQPTPGSLVEDEPQDSPTPFTTPEQPTPGSLVEDEPQDPPTPLTTPEQPNLHDPPSLATTAPPTNDPTLVIDSLGCPADAPVRLAAFTIDPPPAFITSDTIKYLEAVPGDEPWINMVNAYFKFEELSNEKDRNRRLPTGSRPPEVGMWIKKRLYDDSHTPFISDVDAYRKMWTDWWMECQPAWRRNEGWPPTKERAEGTTWEKLSAAGKNGLFLVVMSTCWWAASLKTTDDRLFFDQAVDDVRWVIEQQLQGRIATDAPPVHEDGLNTPECAPVPLLPYLQRKGEKRQVKPTPWVKKLMKANATLTG